jgi:hypothetical protein
LKLSERTPQIYRSFFKLGIQLSGCFILTPAKFFVYVTLIDVLALQLPNEDHYKTWATLKQCHKGLLIFHRYVSKVVADEFEGRMDAAAVLVGGSQAREVIQYNNFHKQLEGDVAWLAFAAVLILDQI